MINMKTMKIKVKACFVCLKRLQISLPSRVNDDDDDDNDSDCNMFTKFLKFAFSYLKVTYSAGAVCRDGVNVLCEGCKGLIKYLCKLYTDLLQAQLRLAWKLDDLGKRLESSKWEASGKFGDVLIKSLAEQIVGGGGGGGETIGGAGIISKIRSSLLEKCREKSQEMQPDVQIQLMPESSESSEKKNNDDDVIVSNGTIKMQIYMSNSDSDGELEKDFECPSPFLQPVSCPSTSMEEHIEADEEEEEVEFSMETPTDLSTLDEQCEHDADKSSTARKGRKATTKEFANMKRMDHHLCQYCNQSFTGAEFKAFQIHLRNHEHYHPQDKTVPCYFCNKHFGLQQSRDVHLKIHHSNMMKCEFDFCGETFQSHTDYNEHLRTHLVGENNTIYECSVCSLEFTSKDFFQLHELLHIIPCPESDINHRFRCPKCKGGFNNAVRLQDHFNVKHGANLMLHKCSKCDNTYPTLQNLQYHLRNHEKSKKKELLLNQVKNKSLKCEECQVQVENVREYSIHQFNYHKSFMCKICRKEFSGFLARRDHVQQEHDYICGVCKEHFSTHYKLNQHRRLLHKPETEACQNAKESNEDETENEENSCDIESKPIMCKDCGDVFPVQQQLQSHLQRHEKSLPEKVVPCYFCYKSFALMQSLGVHLSLQHSRLLTDGKPFRCDISSCGQLFSRHIEYNKHLESHFKENDAVVDYDFCKVCHLGFTNPDLLQLHELLHTPPSPGAPHAYKFSCPKCEISIGSAKKLQEHFNVRHGAKVLLYKCPKCQASFPSRLNLNSHQMRKHKVNRQYAKRSKAKNDKGKLMMRYVMKCDECQKQFRNKRLHSLHVYNNHSAKTCEHCGEKFKGWRTYHHHIQTTHQNIMGDRHHPCDLCNNHFKSWVHLKRHQNYVHFSKRHNCSLCEKTFVSKKELENHHIISHNESAETDIICHLCGDTFKLERSLAAHLARHHPESAVIPKRTMNKHQCPHCQKFFAYKQLLAEHVPFCSLGILGMNECKICGKPLENLLPGRVRTHLMTHMSPEEKETYAHNSTTRKYVCHICGKEMVSKSGFNDHTKRHDEKGKLQCPECPRFYFVSTLLRDHIMKEHGKEKAEKFVPRTRKRPHKPIDGSGNGTKFGKGEKCRFPGCGLKFLARVKGENPRKDHVKESHSDKGYEFMCTDCGKIFQKEEKLQDHVNIHNEVKEHQCPHCPKSYFRQAGLEEHLNVVHGEGTQQIFKCTQPNCALTFRRKHYLNRHLRTVHFISQRRRKTTKKEVAPTTRKDSS